MGSLYPPDPSQIYSLYLRRLLLPLLCLSCFVFFPLFSVRLSEWEIPGRGKKHFSFSFWPSSSV